jgi:dolichol-phosphate mannosyltransferase
MGVVESRRCSARSSSALEEGMNAGGDDPLVPDVSVVVPVYGCAGCLEVLHARVHAAVTGCGASYEIVFVDDRSPDDAWTSLRSLCAQYPAVRAFRLSRNFGQHAAITAGLAQARGRWVVVMDCDLQDPPEEIPVLLHRAREGFDVVFARRKEKKHSLYRRLSARMYFALMNVFNRSRLVGEYGCFSLVSRRVVDAVLTLGDRERHYLLILHWLGFATSEIQYEHAHRHSGASSYTLRRLVQHALSGMLFQTTVLLRWIVYLGFSVSIAGALLAGWFVFQYFVHNVLPGYTSLAVLILVIGGFIIISTGITGLYIGRIFEQVKQRPLYVIDRTIEEGLEQ